MPESLDDLQVPAGEIVEPDGTVRAATRSAREILDEIDADENFLDQLGTICGTKGGGA